MTIALARRYRPRRFADLVVQDHVAAALRGAVVKDRVGHGYLLTGPRGVGKTTVARILAMALNCENRAGDGEPCGECATCLRIWNGSTNLDVVEMDAASNRGVDDARELRESAMYAASQAGHHKVYIVDEAHMLTREAWNVLLKILEEPPPGVVFVFATTEPQKIANAAAPVMSRLQRFDFRRIGALAIQQRLRQVLIAEKLDAEDDALLLIARHADGGMRDALSVLDQCLSFGDGPLTAARVRQTLGLVDDESYGEILATVAAHDPSRVFGIMDRVVDSGADLAEFAGGLAEMLRALVMHHYGTEAEGLTDSARSILAAAAAGIGPEDAVRMLKLLGESENALRRSNNPRIVLETLILRWAMMDRAADLRAILSGQAPAATITIRAPEAPRPAALPAVPAPAPSPAVAAPQGAPRAPVDAPRRAPEAAPVAPDMPPDEPPRARSARGGTLDWSQIVAAAARQSPLLGQALGQATPRVDDPHTVSLQFGPDSALFQDGIARQLSAVETIISSALGRAVSVRIDTAAAAAPASEGKGRRLSAEEHRSERLTEFRRKDAALDAAANALDLELVDEE